MVPLKSSNYVDYVWKSVPNLMAKLNSFSIQTKPKSPKCIPINKIKSPLGIMGKNLHPTNSASFNSKTEVTLR